MSRFLAELKTDAEPGGGSLEELKANPPLASLAMYLGELGFASLVKRLLAKDEPARKDLPARSRRPRQGYEDRPPSAESRIFWFFLPLILAILALNVLYLASPLNIFAGLLLALVGAVVYFTSAWISGLNLKPGLEKNELRGIVSGLEDALVVHDQNLKVTFFNPARRRCP